MVFWKVFIILLNIFPNPFVRLANIFVKKTKIKNSFYLSNSKQKIPLKIYLSNNKQKTPTLILFPGATPLGEDHLMLNKFAKSISYAGVNVFIPRIPDLKEVKINEKSIDQMIDAYNSIVDRDYVDQKKIIGIGLSFAGSLWIKASTSTKIKIKPARVISYGSFFDFNDTIKFIMTGKCSIGEKHYKIKPDHWGRIVFLYNYLDYYQYSGDNRKIKLFLNDKVLNDGKMSLQIISEFNRQDKLFFEKFFSDDTKFLLKISDEIIKNVEHKLKKISPKNFVYNVDFPISLIHGLNDSMIPFTETVKFDKFLNEKKINVDTFVSSFHEHATIKNDSKSFFLNLKELNNMMQFIAKIFKPILKK